MCVRFHLDVEKGKKCQNYPECSSLTFTQLFLTTSNKFRIKEELCTHETFSQAIYELTWSNKKITIFLGENASSLLVTTLY